ncbi:MAG: thioredoxin fold domain-containing protein, partial [Gaiella sp.]
GIAALAGGTVAFLALMRSYGGLLLRLEKIEAGLAQAGIAVAGGDETTQHGLEPGSPAPWFLTTDIGGAGRSRDDLLVGGRRLLLVFTSPHCGPCSLLLPEAGRWQRELASELTVAFASAGAPEAVRAEAQEFELDHVLVDEHSAIAESFAVSGTPSAVLIADDGTIASWVASGGAEIEELVRLAQEPSEEAGLPLGAPVPALEARTLDGGRLLLSDLRGRETVLLFWNPGCGFCQSMRDDLARWDRDEDGGPRLVVVSSADAVAAHADGFLSTVLLDEGFELGSAFGATGTPMAVLLDSEGRVASGLVTGADAVLGLAQGQPERV